MNKYTSTVLSRSTYFLNQATCSTSVGHTSICSLPFSMCARFKWKNMLKKPQKRLFCVFLSKSLSLALHQRRLIHDPATSRRSIHSVLRQLEPLLLFWTFSCGLVLIFQTPSGTVSQCEQHSVCLSCRRFFSYIFSLWVAVSSSRWISSLSTNPNLLQ